MRDQTNTKITITSDEDIKIVRSKKSIRITTKSEASARAMYGLVMSIINDIENETFSDNGEKTLISNNQNKDLNEPIGFHIDTTK